MGTSAACGLFISVLLAQHGIEYYIQEVSLQFAVASLVVLLSYLIVLYTRFMHFFSVIVNGQGRISAPSANDGVC